MLCIYLLVLEVYTLFSGRIWLYLGGSVSSENVLFDVSMTWLVFDLFSPSSTTTTTTNNRYLFLLLLVLHGTSSHLWYCVLHPNISVRTPFMWLWCHLVLVIIFKLTLKLFCPEQLCQGHTACWIYWPATKWQSACAMGKFPEVYHWLYVANNWGTKHCSNLKVVFFGANTSS